MYCSFCGKEISDNAVVCVHCGCEVKKVNNSTPSFATDSTAQAPQISIILGIVGIIGAWLFALIGHIASIVGIAIGMKEYKNSEKSTGLILSIVGEVCSIISSVIGIIMVSSY